MDEPCRILQVLQTLSLSLSLSLCLSVCLSLSLCGKLFLFTLMQIWHVSFRGSGLPWFYWRNDIAPAGIKCHSIPTYHKTHVFATVIRSFHCFKIGRYKFLAEWGSVYWLTAYYISMPPSLLERFIQKCCSQSHFAWAILVKQLQLTPFWLSVAVNSLKRVKTCGVRTLPRIYRGTNEYCYVILLQYIH